MLTLFLVSLSVGAVIAMGLFLFGDFGDTEMKIFETTFAIGIYSLLGLCIGVLYDKRKYIFFASLSICIILAGLLYLLGLIWSIFEPFDDSVIFRLAIVSVVIPISLAHSSLLLVQPDSSSTVTFTRIATLLCIGIVAGMISVLLLFNLENIGEFYYRLLGVFAVLGVLGTIAVLIYARNPQLAQ